ncbi:hypothetical protein ElP_74920 (plasmid) [Tautonia plasticadhaerens]|uniref:Uncharacterized protein n=1 Tax=Tautonia plasticadhaerens TaxID=2527974 RepID=A0A518HF98_9BACT|nr:hypothetical protein ElP_74920 [Tautonia plasticadhaerens]
MAAVAEEATPGDVGGDEGVDRPELRVLVDEEAAAEGVAAVPTVARQAAVAPAAAAGEVDRTRLPSILTRP